MNLDEAVQEYVHSLRMAGGDVVLMVAVQGIIAARDVSKHVSRGGHIKIT